ncbi:hypothetical protein [Actinomadura sp. GTD37]|uniref:hypothetical protein n=1 Tax=Actinomadura sp. GTD37 TaxID=1778030 RepID=UPI0035C00F9F
MRDMFGPAEKSHAAVRRRAPQVAAAIVLDEESGVRRLRVTYRDAGPYIVGWGGTAYEWRSGPASGLPLPADAERAADSIAAALGALAPPEPSDP